MKPATATAKEMIEVDALRVGMFVHLDVGWMSHPFPLSSFRIASAEQIATIRSLGLKQRALEPGAKRDARRAGSACARIRRIGRRADCSTCCPARPSPPTATADAEAHARAPNTAASSPTSAPRSPSASASSPRRRASAGRSPRWSCCKPQQARANAEALSRALVDKMLGAGELCIRLLSEAAGDKASTHALNVTIISLLMGRSFGLAEAEMIDLGVGAMLHDIGKLDLPDRVRHREDHFTPAELRAYEEHVAHGVAHARRMGLSAGATLVIAQHHEHADGSGFPLRSTATA